MVLNLAFIMFSTYFFCTICRLEFSPAHFRRVPANSSQRVHLAASSVIVSDLRILFDERINVNVAMYLYNNDKFAESITTEDIVQILCSMCGQINTS